MLRVLADQNFDGDIVRGLLRVLADVDIVTAHQAGLSKAPDPELLEWAAVQERVVLTHDRRTMPNQAKNQIRQGMRMCGIVVVPKRLSLGETINDLVLIASCSLPDNGRTKSNSCPCDLSCASPLRRDFLHSPHTLIELAL
jgi:hypothetical protein